ncbi:unnamed protein product [Mycena citricolor]|uniref:Uncharacterized protein n=1 Tax=Mycena citricolor TaxID=2018698 RepID=A0AAD2GQV0_9AGAR|nr:unnamed protein product [Mycena citricolor]
MLATMREAAPTSLPQVNLETIGVAKCKQCGRDSSFGYKRCAECRAKRAATARRAAERKKRALLEQTSALKDATPRESATSALPLVLPPFDGGRKQKLEPMAQAPALKDATPRANGASASLPILPLFGGGRKRKLELMTETEDAIERIKKRFKGDDPFFKAKSYIPVEKKIDSFEKFAGSSDVHKFIKLRYPATGTGVSLRCTYALVADPAVDHKARAGLVAQELRQKTSLSFGTLVHHKYRTSTSYTLVMTCTCSPPGEIKRASSDIFLHFAALSNKMHSSVKAGSSINECSGRVKIRVEEDKSHPRWIGQRVKIFIDHPRRLNDI